MSNDQPILETNTVSTSTTPFAQQRCATALPVCPVSDVEGEHRKAPACHVWPYSELDTSEDGITYLACDLWGATCYVGRDPPLATGPLLNAARHHLVAGRVGVDQGKQLLPAAGSGRSSETV